MCIFVPSSKTYYTTPVVRLLLHLTFCPKFDAKNDARSEFKT